MIMRFRKRKKEKKEESEKLLCSCLFDTIIETESDCMFQVEDEKEFRVDDLDYNKKLNGILGQHRIISEEYCRLSILTNEELNIDDDVYFRVCRVIFEDHIFDLNKLRDLTKISVWSNGSNYLGNSTYLIYWRGKRIHKESCPPTRSRIGDIIEQHFYYVNHRGNEEYRDLIKIDIYDLESVLISL